MTKVASNKINGRSTRNVVTREDVARAAGVAGSTVSLALRGDSRVKSDTRKLVKMVADQLNYRPMASARALSSGRTHTIAVVLSKHAVVIPEAFNAYSIAFCAISNALAQRHYHMSFVTAPQEDLSSGQQGSSRFIQENSVDGAILFLHPRAPFSRMMANESTPCVVVDDGPSATLVTVYQNESRAAELAVEHLVSLGHKRILYLARKRASTRSGEFVQGYLRGMTAAELPAFPGWDRGEWDDSVPVSQYMEHILGILRGPKPPTAVITYDNYDGTELIGFLMSHGISVPGDISVASLQDVGCATIMDHGVSAIPRITCTANAQAQMAKTAVEQILSIIENHHEDTSRSVILEPELVVRESTGPVGVKKTKDKLTNSILLNG